MVGSDPAAFIAFWDHNDNICLWIFFAENFWLTVDLWRQAD